MSDEEKLEETLVNIIEAQNVPVIDIPGLKEGISHLKIVAVVDDVDSGKHGRTICGSFMETE